MDAESSNGAGSTPAGGSRPNAHEPLRENRAATAPDRATELVAPFGEPLVDAASVAAYLAIDTSTVYRLAQSAVLPAIEVAPRVLRFRATDVREYVERRTRRPAAPGRVKRLLGEARA